ncbi:MFS transporter [Streptomyces thermoviolaceus]|uniref:MFS transporter n=1 Tax=Streptomyces thermoviolaceus TaxID=1952 RepID=UPI0033AC92E0
MSSPGTTETPAPSPARAETGNRLPVGRLLAFTTAGFLAIMTETMPAGLLPQIGDGLDVTEAWAGQLVTLYAIGSTVAAIPIIAATRSMNRRPLLLWAVGGLLVFNTVTALSALYGLTLFARFVAGMASGVIWGVLAGYARRLVPAALQGRALAIVGVGQPIALTFGVPLGTWLGSLFDWRGVFWIMSAVALLLMLWVRALVPDVPGQSAAERLPIRRIFTTPGVRPVLAVVFFWILAHNILYTYIAPFLEKAGLKDRVDVALLVFGAAAIVGIRATGVLPHAAHRDADQPRRVRGRRSGAGHRARVALGGLPRHRRLGPDLRRGAHPAADRDRRRRGGGGRRRPVDAGDDLQPRRRRRRPGRRPAAGDRRSGRLPVGAARPGPGRPRRRGGRQVARFHAGTPRRPVSGAPPGSG